MTLSKCPILLLAVIAGTARAEPKREVPDYDGRGNPDAKPSDALWIPRVLLAPLYFVHEYVVRRPVGALVKTAERDHWVDLVERVLYLGSDHDTFATRIGHAIAPVNQPRVRRLTMAFVRRNRFA
jgi:hypothetical protein